MPVFRRPSEPTPRGRVREGVLSSALVVLVSYSTASTRSGLRALADSNGGTFVKMRTITLVAPPVSLEAAGEVQQEEKTQTRSLRNSDHS